MKYIYYFFFLISGWEVSHDLLHWHKYDQDNQEKKVRMKMSHLSWSEQRIFQHAFNKYGETTIESQIPTSTPNKDLGMISHKKSLITVFGHKHKIKNFIKKFGIFHEKISAAFDFGLYLE